MKDRLKLAEEICGGLWAVDAEELPKLTTQNMPLITEDEVRRVVNKITDGRAKELMVGVQWNLEHYRGHT
eukprot:14519802-Heterocapsa_arctica.AAC.1